MASIEAPPDRSSHMYMTATPSPQYTSNTAHLTASGIGPSATPSQYSAQNSSISVVPRSPKPNRSAISNIMQAMMAPTELKKRIDDGFDFDQNIGGVGPTVQMNVQREMIYKHRSSGKMIKITNLCSVFDFELAKAARFNFSTNQQLSIYNIRHFINTVGEIAYGSHHDNVPPLMQEEIAMDILHSDPKPSIGVNRANASVDDVENADFQQPKSNKERAALGFLSSLTTPAEASTVSFKNSSLQSMSEHPFVGRISQLRPQPIIQSLSQVSSPLQYFSAGDEMEDDNTPMPSTRPTPRASAYTQYHGYTIVRGNTLSKSWGSPFGLFSVISYKDVRTVVKKQGSLTKYSVNPYLERIGLGMAIEVVKRKSKRQVICKSTGTSVYAKGTIIQPSKPSDIQHLELSSVATAYVYFEKLIIRNFVNKSNPVCLLLAVKVNDPKDSNYEITPTSHFDCKPIRPDGVEPDSAINSVNAPFVASNSMLSAPASAINANI
ncbi:hypothetical protein BSLG_005691 [Batrachochytrium salamandrivorans]|nr:hypothetical protein BSLG_005691 [Batrachochytrium salamandrivorans]